MKLEGRFYLFDRKPIILNVGYEGMQYSFASRPSILKKLVYHPVDAVKAECRDDLFMKSIIEMGLVLYVRHPLRGIAEEPVILEDGLWYTGGGYKKSTMNRILKRALDIVGSIVGLAVTALLFVFLAIPIAISTRDTPIFAQKRVGYHGRPMTIYKFRSMRRGAEREKKKLLEQNEMQGNMFKMKDDPRITKLGKLLRATSIDEFPQFWEVFTGRMSIVGTRPPTLDEVANYEPHHKGRLNTKPGITGLWQVSGRNDVTDFEEVCRLDVEYIKNSSVLLDIKIIFMTVLTVFRHTGK